MSKPSGEEAAGILIAWLQRSIQRSSDELAKYLATGECRKLQNPFTGGEWHIGMVREVGAMRRWFESAGISQSAELESLLRDLLRSHGYSQVGSFFVDIDGGSGLHHEVDLELRVVDGEPLPDYMHELFKAKG